MCNVNLGRNQVPDLKVTQKNNSPIKTLNKPQNTNPTASSLTTNDIFLINKTQVKVGKAQPFTQTVKKDNLTVNVEFTTKDVKSKINYRPDLVQAQKWKPGEVGLTGVQSNKIINKTYSDIDELFTEYLGVKEPVANWMTFGKYASTESGIQIKTIEGTIEALKTLNHSNESYKDNPKAVKAFSQILSNPESRVQGVIMGVQIARNISSNSFVQNLLIDNLKELAQTGNNSKVTSIMSLGVLALPGINKSVDKAINEMSVLHNGLVEGNTLIYQNIVPAYEIFLNAEKSGKDGVKALKSNGYGKPASPNDKKIFADSNIKDPQGFLLEAFTCYKDAQKAYKKGDKAKGDSLMHKGNLLIGCQEQMCILQRDTIFGGKMANMVDAMSGTMSITDGGGKKNPLLNTKLDPSGKQSIEEQFKIIKNILDKDGTKQKGWSDFETRMGIKEVSKGTPNSIEIRVPSKNNELGQVKYYVPRDINEPLAQGTISKYFVDGLSGENAKRNILDKPREINQIYTSSDMKIGSNNYQLDRIVSEPFNSEEDALNKAKDLQNKQKNSFFDSVEDFAVTKVYENNKYKYYVKTIDSLNEDDKDITGVGELRMLKFVGQSADNIYAMLANDGTVMKNPLYKKNI